MRLLFTADLHYTLKQFDWLVANAARFDSVILGGDLLDIASPLDPDVQIVVIEKYLARLREKARLLVSSGNHDGDSRNAADESVAAWILATRADGVAVDWDSVELGGVLVTLCPWWDGPVSQAAVEAMLTREAARAPARWIWIHHAPPSASPVCWTGKCYGGDEILRGWIERFRPEMVLSGHIHQAPFYAQGSWIDRIGPTWVFNPGRQPGNFPAHLSLDLASRRAEWISIEGESVRDLAPPEG